MAKKNSDQIELEREIVAFSNKLNDFKVLRSETVPTSLENYLSVLKNAISGISIRLYLCEKQQADPIDKKSRSH